MSLRTRPPATPRPLAGDRLARLVPGHARGSEPPAAAGNSPPNQASEFVPPAFTAAGSGRWLAVPLPDPSSAGPPSTPDPPPDPPVPSRPRPHRRPRSTRWRYAVADRLPLVLRDRLDPGRAALSGLALILVTGVLVTVHWWWSAPAGPVERPTLLARGRPAAHSGAAPPTEARPPVPATASGPQVTVHVAGRVRRPGVLRLPAGARVTDALTAAGGPASGTDLTTLNLARVLVDGEQILVGVVPPAEGGQPATDGRINLNTATVSQLDQLPGIGPALAERIVRWRREHSGFRSVDQLRQVSGIGDRRLAELRDRVRL